MKNHFEKIQLQTKKQFEVADITDKVINAVKASGVTGGQVLVFIPHTTAAVRINHYESLLLQDLMKMLYRLAPIDISYSHDLFELRENVAANERTNGHAHIKNFLLGCSVNLIVQESNLILGAKQSVLFIELDGGRSREIYINIIGE